MSSHRRGKGQLPQPPVEGVARSSQGRPGRPKQATPRSAAGFPFPLVAGGLLTAATVLVLGLGPLVWKALRTPPPLSGGAPEAVSSPPRTIESLSVILPCANETEFVRRTIASIFEATPSDLLKEIIVIDDASVPPITEDHSDDFLAAHRVKVIRHNNQEGLIRSKKEGGDAALGDAIVFLDCHVKPMEAWTVPMLANLRENPKRVVVPVITFLDPDSWKEIPDMASGMKMCLTWSADFNWCNEYPGPYVPVMSGGLLAMTKYWWETTGGYDEQMLSWGGENLDQSLRTWLCGGEIVVAHDSRVAHMWRDPAKPKTVLRYTIPTNHVLRNRLRAAQAWMGPWADKVRTFPEFADFREGGPLDIGSLANMDQHRSRLECRDFAWYLSHFSDLYLDSGWLPRSVFHLRERKTLRCLHYQEPKTSHDIGHFTLAPCSRSCKTQRFNGANAQPGAGCCSGLKLWDHDVCLHIEGGGLIATRCSAFGHNPNQQLRLSESGLLRWEAPPPAEMAGGACLTPQTTAARQDGTGGVGAMLFEGTGCTARVEEVSAGDAHGFVVMAGRLCLSAPKAAEWGEPLAFGACEDHRRDVLFRRGNWSDRWGWQVQHFSGQCVDAKGGQGPIVWPCNPVELENLNQFYDATHGGAFLWTPGGDWPLSCIDAAKFIAFEPCATAVAEGEELEAEAGQGFQKHELHDDGSFALQEVKTSFCLGHTSRRSLCSRQCSAEDPSQRWHHEDGHLRAAHTNLCVDANDRQVPGLAQCARPEDDRLHAQQLKLHKNGWVELPGTWSDNGRVRHGARCLDSRPSARAEIALGSCEALEQQGLTWEKIWEEVPLETRLFEEARTQ